MCKSRNGGEYWKNQTKIILFKKIHTDPYLVRARPQRAKLFPRSILQHLPQLTVVGQMVEIHFVTDGPFFFVFCCGVRAQKILSNHSFGKNLTRVLNPDGILKFEKWHC
jgi:hypothetical protein